ncbi:guanine nucleotide exchange factor subunit Rich isoform X1 [Dendroctonus ponderosae]|uniref:guanine nucleotide exchange factor subunit Rich isoform X1 n=1 Tax=Dendroctonus ponderosae TaxID=77166 RepID=UPI002035473E|nr:guanine nucleotide exchange factor subunit Rich isoform X1 [Dendroctonus ponderosae]XP_048518045.1 guanine nucleotide exchange factor subunit Rich isoform X1 [Dendroctonus ponderosae]
MYFPIGWPKVVQVPNSGQGSLRQIKCNRDRILVAILTDHSLSIWFCKPCVPIVYHRRTGKSLEKFGTNVTAEWKPDSSKIVIATSEGHLLYYKLNVISNQKGLYVQTDSPHANLRRDSAELFIKETIPPLSLEISEEALVWDGKITGIVCITMTEIMISTTENHVLRYRWDGTQNRDYTLDLRRIPFCINQQVSKAIPIVEENIHIVDIEYSPLVGGFSIVLNDGRAAFLTASSLKFDPNQVQGIWAQNIEDATCTVINHKYRLITFGRANSECVVYYVDDSTGGLEVSHNCILSSKDYPGCPGAVGNVLWTPDGCALVAAWCHGGIAMWSTFGALLMCSLGWDYGLNVDIQKSNPLQVLSMDFATEGYQLWMIRENCNEAPGVENGDISPAESSLIQLDFAKSAMTINPCMSHQGHLYLQAEDRLYVNSADNLIKTFSERSNREDALFGDSANSTTTLAEGRQWLVIPVPSTYSATNWPVRYSAIDMDGQNIAIAGRTGIAHYSIQSRRWKLFGNESQEKDFIVAGGLLWWRDYIVLGCYSIVDNSDEIRFYSKEAKLDNKFAKTVPVAAPILLMNVLEDQLITFKSDAQISIWHLHQNDTVGDVELQKVQAIDVSALAVHPACIVSVTLTALRTEAIVKNASQRAAESIVLNISGRLLLVQRETSNGSKFTCLMPTVLASCVENVWVPARRTQDKVHLTEALWLFCGSHGMRVWLPLYPRDGDKQHSFMSKRIMLPFQLKIYPLAILFEDAIILGAENDTVLYTSDLHSPFSLPFSVLQRTSQVYLHQILRQLIRRNLGYHAWEIAKSCMSLPYFPHSLELLLHEVLEEEATSKEPIPDAQLPSVVEFIMEFPVYLQTVVQCARKTEIALWPYLFSAAGKPKDLFQECMTKKQLETAASYLIILQNLETSSVSRQYATLLLNTALDQSKWELAKDLARFLRAIDPNDVESPRNSFILPSKLGSKQTPPVSPNAEEISLILGNVQGSRVRSYSTTVSPKVAEKPVEKMNVVPESPNAGRKKSVPNVVATKTETSFSRTRFSSLRPFSAHWRNISKLNQPSNTAEEFFIDVILQKHARRLLSNRSLTDLGYFAAHLDFHLVAWLGKERDRAARVDDFVAALKHLHEEFQWPYPPPTSLALKSQPASDYPVSVLEDHLRSLKVDVLSYPFSRVGDSGYMSFQGLPGRGLATPVDTLEQSSQVADEIELDSGSATPKASRSEPLSPIDGKLPFFGVENGHGFSTNLGLQTTVLQTNHSIDESVMSTVSSVWGGDDREMVGSPGTENWEVPSTQILEQLSNGDSRGSHKSEIQLRYLLHLFMEASCLEWSLLIAVLLRDAMAVLRTVNAAKSHEHSIESVSRLKQGLLILNYWTTTECIGYKAFMLAIQNQLAVLSRILDTKIQQQRIVEYQQAVSASLNKASLQKPRSRKSSQSQDAAQKNSASVVNGKSDATAIGVNCAPEEDLGEDSVIPESTGCTIS